MDWHQIFDFPPSLITIAIVVSWSVIAFFSLRSIRTANLSIVVTLLALISRSFVPIVRGDVQFSIDWILQMVLATSLGAVLSVYIMALIAMTILGMFIRRGGSQTIFSRK